MASALVVASVAAAAATGTPLDRAAETRVEQRTVACATQLVAGVRKVSAWFTPRAAPSDTNPDGWAASAGVLTGFSGTGNRALVSVGDYSLSVRVDGRRCRSSSRSVPLTPSGLPGPPVRFGQRADCVLAGRVIVRARVVSEGGRFTRVDLAVRAEVSGTPLAYVRINRDGSGAFYSSPRCD